MSAPNVENVAPTGSASASIKSKQGSLSSSSARSGKKLQTLQPSAKNQKLLVGSDGVVRLGSQGKKKDIKIYEDPVKPTASSTPDQKRKQEHKTVQASVSSVSAGTQVENDDTAQHRAEVEMYGAEEDLPLEYWKDLAEKRREALEVSLTENESLHTSLSFLEEENERIKEEADTYKSLAEQANELAQILNSIDSDAEEEVDEEQDKSVGQDHGEEEGQDQDDTHNKEDTPEKEEAKDDVEHSENQKDKSKTDNDK